MHTYRRTQSVITPGGTVTGVSEQSAESTLEPDITLAASMTNVEQAISFPAAGIKSIMFKIKII